MPCRWNSKDVLGWRKVLSRRDKEPHHIVLYFFLVTFFLLLRMMRGSSSSAVSTAHQCTNALDFLAVQHYFIALYSCSGCDEGICPHIVCWVHFDPFSHIPVAFVMMKLLPVLFEEEREVELTYMSWKCNPCKDLGDTAVPERQKWENKKDPNGGYYNI